MDCLAARHGDSSRLRRGRALASAANRMQPIRWSKDAILNGVDAISALNGKTVTGGRLNARGALNPVRPPAQSPLWHAR